MDQTIDQAVSLEKKIAVPFWCKIEPVDIIAMIVIIGGLTLTGLHINGTVGNMLTAICFYYFGKKGNVPLNKPI